jgi:hypothetical protein
MNDKELIQALVNALSNSRKFVYAATKESFRADEVYAEAMAALDAANKMGYDNTNPEPPSEGHW